MKSRALVIICLLVVSSAFSATTLQEQVSFGKVAEQERIEVKLPISAFGGKLTVEDFRASCSCVKSIGLKKGQGIDGQSKELSSIPVILNLIGISGTANVEVAAKCKSENNETIFLVWRISGEVVPLSSLKKFYDFGLREIGDSQSKSIRFSTAKKCEVNLVNNATSEQMNCLQLASVGDQEFRIDFQISRGTLGLHTSTIGVLIDGVENRVVVAWEVYDPKLMIKELVIPPRKFGEWSSVKFNPNLPKNSRINKIFSFDDRVVQFRLNDKIVTDNEIIRHIECIGLEAGPVKGEINLVIENDAGIENIAVPFAAFFLE